MRNAIVRNDLKNVEADNNQNFKNVLRSIKNIPLAESIKGCFYFANLYVHTVHY